MSQNREMNCFCDFEMTQNATEIKVDYNGSAVDTCGIEFTIYSATQKCAANVRFLMKTKFERIKFSRSANSSSTACAIIYLGKIMQILMSLIALLIVKDSIFLKNRHFLSKKGHKMWH